MMPSTHRRTPPASPLPSPQTPPAAHSMAWMVAGGVIALALAWLFALRPALAEYRRARAVPLQQLQDRLLQRRSSVAKLVAIETKFSSIASSEQEKIEAILPDEIGVSDLIANIEAIAQLSNLTLVSVGVDEQSAALPAFGDAQNTALPQGVQIIPLQVRVEGNNYLTLQHLLKRIETNIRLFDIPALAFEAQGDDLMLSLVAYAYRPLQPLR